MQTKSYLDNSVKCGGEVMPRGKAWQIAYDAAKARGAHDPYACADRYMQGLDTSNE